jgi:hypothetical protein
LQQPCGVGIIVLILYRIGLWDYKDDS